MTGLRMMVVWAIAGALCASGLFALPNASRDRSATLAPPPSRPITTQEPTRPLASDVLVRAAPFRAARVPAGAPYRAAADATVAPAERPAWKLTGVLDGPPRVALLEEAGSTYVLAVGDELGGHRIVHVGPDSVVVVNRSMSWTLTLETPWGR